MVTAESVLTNIPAREELLKPASEEEETRIAGDPTEEYPSSTCEIPRPGNAVSFRICVRFKTSLLA